MCSGRSDAVAAEPDEVQLLLPERRRRSLLPLRYVVVVLGLVGCMVDYLVRFGLSVAIVTMVNSTTTTTIPGNHSADPSLQRCPAVYNHTDEGTDGQGTGEGEFSWTTAEQGIILGTFFWGYFFTKTIGGRISEVVGARETMAVTLGGSGLLCMLCPATAAFHPMALAALRFLMGVVQGPSFPALYSVLSRWAPPEELSTMVTIAVSGMSLGSVVAMGSSDWVIEHMGWQWVFWGAGVLALLWTPFWVYFVRNSPGNHPLISHQEKELLTPNLSIKPQRGVPWRSLLRCWRFYPAILAEFAGSWVSNLTTTEGPTFLHDQIGLSLGEVSGILTIGQACGWASSLIFGKLSDCLINRQCLTKTNTRRFMHVIGMTSAVLGLASVVVAGCHKWIVSVLMIIIMTGTSAVFCSYSLAPIDLAPNYAGTLSGLIGIGNINGFLAPVITAELVNQTGGWSASLLLGGGLYLLSGVVYLATVTTEVQEWNYYGEVHSSAEEDIRT